MITTTIIRMEGYRLYHYNFITTTIVQGPHTGPNHHRYSHTITIFKIIISIIIIYQQDRSIDLWLQNHPTNVSIHSQAKTALDMEIAVYRKLVECEEDRLGITASEGDVDRWWRLWLWFVSKRFNNYKLLRFFFWPFWFWLGTNKPKLQ